MIKNGAIMIFYALFWCFQVVCCYALSLESLIFKGVLLFILNGIYFAPFLTP